MNSFDRFSRQYTPPSVSPFRRDLPSDLSNDVPRVANSLFVRDGDASVSVVSTRSVYRLSTDANGGESYVSVADDTLPTPIEPPRSLAASFRSIGRAAAPPTSSFGLAGLTLPQIERLAFLETLVACNGCRRLAARKLGVSEKTMYNKIKLYKLSAELDRLVDDAPRKPTSN